MNPDDIQKIVSCLDLCKSLMDEHGLTAKGWKPVFHDSIRVLGVCRYRRKEISLSKTYCLRNDIEKVKDTILHEICHFLTPGAGHGLEWKIMCVKIGCKPERLCDNADMPIREKRWFATCSKCGQVYKWGKKPTAKIGRGCWCGICRQSAPQLQINQCV